MGQVEEGGTQVPDFEDLDFKIASELRKFLTVNYLKASCHSRKKSSVDEAITVTGQTTCSNDLRVLQNR